MLACLPFSLSFSLLHGVLGWLGFCLRFRQTEIETFRTKQKKTVQLGGVVLLVVVVVYVFLTYTQNQGGLFASFLFTFASPRRFARRDFRFVCKCV